MQEFNVFHRISNKDRINWHLYIDAVYKGNPTVPNLGAEVLSKLLGVGNQGGFRYTGNSESPKYIALFTSGEDIYWKDELDIALGILLYYGDQKEPGKDLHKTKLKGNAILRYVFLNAFSEDSDARKKIPPVFVFQKVKGRDIKFLGLAVPGIQSKPKKEWLTAVWGANRDGDRFLNYKAFFTILDTSNGCAAEVDHSGISLEWLNDINAGKPYDSLYAPTEWKHYIDNVRFDSLTTKRENYIKSKEEQLPSSSEKEKTQMLQALHDYFIEKDRGYSFERFASWIVEDIDERATIAYTTQPFRDGGIDAVGNYRIFSSSTKDVFVEFYMQAKCYNPFSTPVGVKDTARLIARIKERQFGILVTTSYVAKQAYEEILDDHQPIVLITGKTIIDHIYDTREIRDITQLHNWLKREFDDDM